MGSTCKYLGFSSNTTDPDELKKVQDAIVERQAAPEGVPEHERRRGPRQRLDRDGDGLGLRRGAAAAEERQDQVGAAGRGRARLPGGLHRGAEHEQDRGDPGVPELPRRAGPVRRLRQHHRDGLRDACGDAADPEDHLAEPGSGVRPKKCWRRPSSTSIWAPPAQPSGRTRGQRSRRRSHRASGGAAPSGSEVAAPRLGPAGAPRAARADAAHHDGVLRRAARPDRAYSFGSVNQVDFNVFFGWTTGNYRAFTSTCTCTRSRAAWCSRSRPRSCAR